MTDTIRFTVLGRDFDVAPYNIGPLKRAAPYIDRVIASGATNATTVEELTEIAGDFVGVLSVGILMLDPTITLQQLEDSLSLDDVFTMRADVLKLLKLSGAVKTPGEAPAA